MTFSIFLFEMYNMSFPGLCSAKIAETICTYIDVFGAITTEMLIYIIMKYLIKLLRFIQGCRNQAL